jgi:hypothetical protein
MKVTLKHEGVPIVLGVVSAVAVALLVMTAVPTIYSVRSGIPQMPLRAFFVRVNPEGPYALNSQSISSVLQTNVTVVALSTWNRSGPVTLIVSKVVEENGSSGNQLGPVAPYDFLVSPVSLVLQPNGSGVFDLTLVPWSNATERYGPHPNVSFLIDLRCYRYVSQGYLDPILGAQFLEVVIGQ